jgi:universal stress protein A
MKTQTAVRASSSAELSIKKILVPLDFSALSKKTLKYALRLARQSKAELTLFHVLEPALSPAFAGLPDTPAFSEDEVAVAEKNLRALVSSTRAAGGANSKSTLRVGVPSCEIVETARALDVDLIVIGTHGHTGWKHFCIGSTAERVVRAAPCPVLVVREKEHAFV